MHVSNIELVKIINHIINLENCVLPVTADMQTDNGRDVAQDLHDYLRDIVIENMGDPVLGLDIIDKAIFMNDQELLKEIEEVKAIAG